MGGSVVWLEEGASPEEVGARGAIYARLGAAGLPVPKGFVVPRSALERFAARPRARTAGGLLTRLPRDLARAIGDGVRALADPVAVRRSPAAAEPRPARPARGAGPGGRPDRETFLHLCDPADVIEAVRRIWEQALAAAEPQPLAVVVQRFVVPEACALARRDRADAGTLHVESAFGAGDLLAAALIAPDRHALSVADGAVLSRRLGRKAQMSVPRAAGRLARVPVNPARARSPALTDERLAAVAALWRAAEGAAGPLASLGVAWGADGEWVTSAIPDAAAAAGARVG